MAPGDSEILRRLIDAWNRNDLDALIELSDPELAYVNAPNAVEPGTRRGIEEVKEVMRAQWEILPGATVEVDHVHERGDEYFTLGRILGTMQGSEAQVSNRILLKWTIRDGKLVRLEVLGAGSEFDAALADAGLEGPFRD